MDIIKSIEHEQLKNKIPELKVGNTVRVHVKIKEGNKERIQVFEGIIIKVQGGGVNQTFTVRKISYGVGVEKTFLVHSPLVEKVELVRVGKARRAKLFYLRDRLGKSAKTREQVGARIENREITLKEDLSEEEIEKIFALLQEEIKLKTADLSENVSKLDEIRHHNKELEKKKTFEIYELTRRGNTDLEKMSKEELIRIRVLLKAELKLYTEKNKKEEKNNKILFQRIEQMSKKAEIS